LSLPGLKGSLLGRSQLLFVFFVRHCHKDSAYTSTGGSAYHCTATRVAVPVGVTTASNKGA
jgi:hypothetical protein